MQQCKRIDELRAAIRVKRHAGQHIVLVPTMGNLHDGHISLVRKARALSDFVVVSIFVNPLQFGANEDLDNYPNTLEEDQAKLQREGVSLLFLPKVSEMYPNGQEGLTSVQVPGLNSMLCGASRPVHFDGVTTVVNKLFNIVQPDSAVFGEKDFQQMFIIRKMVADLSLPVKIIGAPTMREKDGLAMSSRNNYLSEEQRAMAPAFARVLQDTKDKCSGHKLDPVLFEQAEQQAITVLGEIGFDVDYVQIRDALTLLPVNETSSELVLLAAASLGETRLIDNIMFKAS
ncbi:MAG: pantoate--beta-alanine ligase [Pseudomonadales bacterium]